MASTDDKPRETPVLDYGRPQSDPRSPRCRRWGCALAIASFMALCFAGVGSDFVRIPAPKKIALTAGVLVVLALLTHGTRAHQGGSGSLACCGWCLGSCRC